MTRGVFERRVGLAPRHGRALRKYLKHWNLITEEEDSKPSRTGIPPVFIRLTPKGRSVAEDAIALRRKVHGDAAKLHQPKREKH